MAKEGVTKCEVLSFILSGILIIGGIALLVSRFPQKFAGWQIQDQLIISPNSSIVNAWENPEVPCYMKFYVYNVTNGKEFMNGEKPILEEHGPYTYRMVSPRFDIKFYVNDTVSFRSNHTLYFEPGMSNGSEDDVLFHINLPIVKVSESVQSSSISPLLRQFKVPDKLVKLVGKEDLIVAHTVKEIIFGYDEPMMKLASNILAWFGKDLDPTFGPFHEFNNTDDGLFLVGTGRKNFSTFNVIDRWNGKKLLSYWTTKYANMINGTDGSFLRPNVKRNQTRYTYLPQMQRAAKLEYEQDTTVKSVRTYRYHFANDLLGNITEQPDNAGFCVPEGNCFDSGVLNVGRGDAPIFLSLPHFYLGSENLQNGVVGLSPNKTLHDSFFHTEPLTGAVMRSQERLQINAHVTKSDYFEQLRQVQPVFFPYFWISAEELVNDDIALNLLHAMKVVDFACYLGYIIIFIGLVILGATLAKLYVRRRSTLSRDEEPLISDDHAENA
ncbi:lysosome membrane protein 2-like [Styela clava]